MGQVYRVTHLGLEKQFALKALMQLSGDEPEQRQYARQFATEAKILASLDHPGLTRVVDFFSDEASSYLVTELVQGVTLTQLVEDSLQPVSLAAVTKLANQAFEMLEYLHSGDPPIIVRDIKPDNFMVTSEGRLKLIDFGLAKRFVVGEKTQPIVQGVGTDSYAPMEQYGDGVTDQRSDLFSLGATLYFALTGQAPPPVWKRVSMQEPLLSPLEVNPTVTEPFWEGLKTLLEVDMKSRPADVAQARAALHLDPDLEQPMTGQSTGANLLTALPYGSEFRLASAAEFYPFEAADWLLKVMQAATLAQAREVKVSQNRGMCKILMAIPAHTIPDAGFVLSALSDDRDCPEPWIRELSRGLKMAGEFRTFRLTLDNWRRAWQLRCQGGALEAIQVPSSGQAGLTVEVDYLGRGMDRAKQTAEELVALVRKTRLCRFPLLVDDRPLEAGRPVEKPLFAGDVKDVYLASASMPPDGELFLSPEGPPKSLRESQAWADFCPSQGDEPSTHLDVRCYLQEETHLSGLPVFAFLRQPLKVLWYRYGVLCAQQVVPARYSLELVAHIDGSALPCNASGLKVSPPDLMFPAQLSPLRHLDQILPILKEELESYQPPQPSTSSTVGKVTAGLFVAPLLLLVLGAGAGPVLLKAAAVGGMTGYLCRGREEEALQRACLKAVDAFSLKP